MSRFNAYRKPAFSVGSFDFVNQDPSVISDADLDKSGAMYMPAFIAIWQAIEKATGHRWRNTSYIRQSPTHHTGQAIDLAPDFDKYSGAMYAAGRGSDPVLYKREKLVKYLQRLRDIDFGQGWFNMGIFIEPDHLHIHVLQKDNSPNPTAIVKWQVAKPVYSDTLERMELPVFK